MDPELGALRREDSVTLFHVRTKADVVKDGALLSVNVLKDSWDMIVVKELRMSRVSEGMDSLS
jgi:hypothetical protein